MSILVVGSTHVDFYIKVPRLPQPDETIKGYTFFTRPGGKGANQAVACAKLGATTYFLSAVGKDFLADIALQALTSAGVNVKYVQVDEGTHTGVAFILLSENGENMIIIAPGADNSIKPEHVDKALRELGNEVKVILTQLEIPMETVFYTLKRGKEIGATTILNPAPANPQTKMLLKYTDIITPNRVEASQLSGIEVKDLESAFKAGEEILKKGPRAAIVTLGSGGAALVTREMKKHVPAFKVSAVDTVGAGDAFTAGVAVALLEGKDLGEAVLFANAVAALKVTRIGAQSVPTRSEVEEFIKKQRT